MRYWPFSVIETSPLFPFSLTGELYAFRYRNGKPSTALLHACGAVAASTPHVDAPAIDFVQASEVNYSQIYKDYPTFAEWMRLERSGVYQTDEGLIFVHVNTLH